MPPASPQTFTVQHAGGAVSVSGLGTGEPGLLFVSGLGDPARWWFTVPTREEAQPHWNGGTQEGQVGLATILAASRRVIAYDRAGIGGSSAPDHDRTLEELHAELNAVLNVCQLACPPVLVGHSLGGLLAYTFARRNPNALSGLVLLDPTPLPMSPKPHVSSPERLALTHFEPSEAAPSVLGGLPTLIVAPRTVETVPDVSEQSHLDARFLARKQRHEEFARASERSRYTWVSGSGHYMHLDSPGVVAAAILDLFRHC
ncbi:alpha/beta fold hydrolase [Deinococcus sp. UYEF24]